MTDVWTHKYVQGHYSQKEKMQVSVTAGLHLLGGNKRPHFSVTGEGYLSGNRDVEMCGCLHEMITEEFPEVIPVIALHLSDDTGEPMYAAENGWYFLTGYYGGCGERYYYGQADRYTAAKSPEECLKVCADHLRMDVEQLRAWADEHWGIAPEDRGKVFRQNWHVTKAAFVEWCESMKPRWQQEANDAIVLLCSLIPNMNEICFRGGR